MSVLATIKRTFTSTKSTEQIFGELMNAQEKALEHIDNTVFADKDLAQLVELLSRRSLKTQDEANQALGDIVTRTYESSNQIIGNTIYKLRHDIAALPKNELIATYKLIHMLYAGWNASQTKHMQSVIAQVQTATNELLKHEYYPAFLGPPVPGEH